jgi:hypothetical protein
LLQSADPIDAAADLTMRKRALVQLLDADTILCDPPSLEMPCLGTEVNALAWVDCYVIDIDFAQLQTGKRYRAINSGSSRAHWYVHSD